MKSWKTITIDKKPSTKGINISSYAQSMNNQDTKQTMKKKCICLEDNKMTQALCSVHGKQPEIIKSWELFKSMHLGKHSMHWNYSKKKDGLIGGLKRIIYREQKG